MSKLTEQQECQVWDMVTNLAKTTDAEISKIMEETGATYDYVRGILDTLLDADFS